MGTSTLGTDPPRQVADVMLWRKEVSGKLLVALVASWGLFYCVSGYMLLSFVSQFRVPHRSFLKSKISIGRQATGTSDVRSESTNNRMVADGGIGEDLNGDVPERIGAREKTIDLSVLLDSDRSVCG